MKFNFRKKIITAFSILAALFAASLSQAQTQNIKPDYYGSRNQEAQFVVQSFTYLSQANGAPTVQSVTKDVQPKVKYLLGYMRRSPEGAAAIYPKYTVSILNTESTSDGHYKVYYQINAKGVFNPGQSEYTFLIPISYSTIWNKSQGKCFDTDKEDILDESNFWYHWDPTISGCPLQENIDYIKYTSILNYIQNTTTTYPEYERLFQNGTMNIASFFGVSNYEATDWNPNTSNDIAANDYKHQREEFINNYGMTSRIWSESEVRQYYNPQVGKPIPFVEELSKNTSHGKINVRLFYGNTGLEHDSSAFHVFLKSALATSQVLIYNGHSGIGKNLNIPAIESTRGMTLKLNPSYQIYFFGSCVPYAYYTDMYFQRKVTAADPKGTKNLDIITFGNESAFGNHYDDRLIEAIFKFADENTKTTYQDIIGQNTNYYFGVNGDEDNPTQP